MNSIYRKKMQKKYNVPVIGHFANKSIRFNSIIEAERITGINYTLIFEACVGKLYKARNVYWEFEKGNHYLKYKAHYLRIRQQILEETEEKQKIKGKKSKKSKKDTAVLKTAVGQALKP
jgi:hypothetical protein